MHVRVSRGLQETKHGWGTGQVSLTHGVFCLGLGLELARELCNKRCSEAQAGWVHVRFVQVLVQVFVQWLTCTVL